MHLPQFHPRHLARFALPIVALVALACSGCGEGAGQKSVANEPGAISPDIAAPKNAAPKNAAPKDSPDPPAEKSQPADVQQAAADEPAADEPAADEPDEPQADPFKIPDGSAEELADFIEKVQKLPSGATTQQQHDAHQAKIAEAVSRAAEKIIQGESTDEQAVDAARVLFRSLMHLRSMEDEQAKQRSDHWLETLADDKRPGMSTIVQETKLTDYIFTWFDADEQHKEAFFKGMASYLKEDGKPLDKDHVQFALNVAQAFEQIQDSAAAAKVYQELIPRIKTSKDEELKGLADQLAIKVGLMQIADLDDQGKQDFYNSYEAFLKAKPLDDERIQFANNVARTLELSDASTPAAELYKRLIAALKKSGDPQYLLFAQQLDEKLLFLGLVGKKMDLEGKLLDGKPLDWKAYEGKVVLVDFWATWCRPCLEELPNVLENYELYHDKGFEVVGISLDKDRTRLEGFVDGSLTGQKIPWSILFSDDPNAQGFDDPMVKRFGISGIPAAILVNQEGKVVSLFARGEALGKFLEELLGKPDAPQKEPSPDGDSPAPKQGSAEKGPALIDPSSTPPADAKPAKTTPKAANDPKPAEKTPEGA